ncbi:RHS repeat-associated core domain-containing protein [Pseudomonas sp.]|uniref:RHS repeat-associated core domain-containing protein n=1 Tax=Pseudomonas sp. TaxID=306 RepID=UPI001B1C0588|nr:RHS repeat-associated core domain-containing protein [Pseudomonas sp.]MBO9551425.1 RHS repeat-associated core domain-containing protein [Pseudomonas sp.]
MHKTEPSTCDNSTTTINAPLSDKQSCIITYNTYGHTDSIESNEPKILYNGEFLLHDLYFLGAGYRLYSPTLMRFRSPDVYSPFGIGGLNAYVYCLGDPLNWVDPSGSAPVKPRIAHVSKTHPSPSKSRQTSNKSISTNAAHVISTQMTSKSLKGSAQERYRNSIGIKNNLIDANRTNRGTPRITKKEEFLLHYYNKNFVDQSGDSYSKRQIIMFTIIRSWEKGEPPMENVRKLEYGLNNGEIMARVTDLRKELEKIRDGHHRYDVRYEASS